MLRTVVIRAIVFDLFDTLVDLDWGEQEALGQRVRSTQEALHRALQVHAPVDFETFARTLHEVDLEVRAPRIKAGRELPTVERFSIVLERLGTPSSDLAEELTEVHMAGIRSLVRTVPHHLPLLKRLGARVGLGLCSNFSHAATARRVLQETALLPHFDAVVISEDLGIRKSRPAIFRAVLDRLDASPRETLHVGDRLEADVEGACGVGISPVWITRCVRDPEKALGRYTGPRPVHVIEDLAEIEPLLDAG